MQNLATKVTTDSLTAAEWNELPQEVQNVITAAGQALSSVDLNQLGIGVSTYVGVGDFYSSSGPADAYVLATLGSFQGPPSYFDGMRVRFVPNIANTGGSVTVNVNGLGVRTVVREDGVGNSSNTEYQVSTLVELRYDGGAGNFKLRRIPNAGTATNAYGLAKIATQTEVNAGTNNFSYVTPDTLDGRTATEGRTGVAELASQPEADAGTDDLRIVTPLKLQTKMEAWPASLVPNDSSVSGSKVKDALETLDAKIDGTVTVSIIAADISNATTSNVEIFPDLPVTANKNYTFEGYLNINGVNTEGLTLEFNGPAGSDGFAEIDYTLDTTNPVSSNRRISFSLTPMSFSIPSSEVSSTGAIFVKIHGAFTIGGTAGNVSFDFKKVSSVSQDIIAREGSWIKVSS